MMLSFLKLYRLSRGLKLIFSNKSDLMKISINVNHPNLNAQNGIFQFKLYSTEVTKEEEVIPLEEISNFVSTHKNFNSEGLNPLIDVINKHKAYRKGLPDYIKLTDVRDILECETPSQRSNYLTYLFKKEQIKLKSKEKKLKEKIARERRYMEMLENDKKNNHIQYGLGKNTLILRTLRRSVMRYYEKRLANAALFGQKIVIDLAYDKLMSKKEKKACISQIRLLYSCNRLSHDPYDLYICNATSENRCVEFLRYEMPNVDESFATLTEQSYLELFPKENLVYLSPHASEVLTTYDPKAVYIIDLGHMNLEILLNGEVFYKKSLATTTGGFVDTVKRENISSNKAQEEGIKSYRLPLDECVAWGAGSKSLTINQVFSILQTKRDTGDWKEAFKHLPTRKLKKIALNSDNTELYSDKLYVVSSN